MHTSPQRFGVPFLHLRQKSGNENGIAVKSSSMNSTTSFTHANSHTYALRGLIRPALRIRNVRQPIVAVAEYLHNLAIEFYAQKQSTASAFHPPAYINVQTGAKWVGIEKLYPFCFSYINYIIFAAFGRGQKLPNSSIGIIIKPMMKITLAGTWTIIACNIIKAIKALKLPENPGHGIWPWLWPIEGGLVKRGGIQR